MSIEFISSSFHVIHSQSSFPKDVESKLVDKIVGTLKVNLRRISGKTLWETVSWKGSKGLNHVRNCRNKIYKQTGYVVYTSPIYDHFAIPSFQKGKKLFFFLFAEMKKMLSYFAYK